MNGREQTSQALPTAEKAYYQSMSVYPSFMAWETQIVAQAHLQGLSGSQISQLSPFRQYQNIEQYSSQGRLTPWQGSFTKLFADSQNTGQLIGFGNFQLIRRFGEQFQRTCRRLDIEEYFQEALFFVVPSILSTYDDSRGSFLPYMKRALRYDLDSRIDILLHRESTLPIGQHAERVPAKKQTNRLPIDRLSRRVTTSEGEEDEVETVGSRIEDTESTEPFDSFSRVDAIHALYDVAGVRADQAEVFTLLEINGEKQKPVARQLGVSDRTVRTRRTEALAALQQLGKEQVHAILQGTLDELLTPA